MGLIQNFKEVEKLHPKLAEILTDLNEGINLGSTLKSFVREFMMDDGTVWRIPVRNILKRDSYNGGRRLSSEQLNLMKSEKGVTKVTDPLQSYHCWGLAVDLVVRKAGFTKVTVGGREWDFANPSGMLSSGLVSYMET